MRFIWLVIVYPYFLLAPQASALPCDVFFTSDAPAPIVEPGTKEDENEIEYPDPDHPTFEPHEDWEPEIQPDSDDDDDYDSEGDTEIEEPATKPQVEPAPQVPEPIPTEPAPAVVPPTQPDPVPAQPSPHVLPTSRPMRLPKQTPPGPRRDMFPVPYRSPSPYCPPCPNPCIPGSHPGCW